MLFIKINKGMIDKLYEVIDEYVFDDIVVIVVCDLLMI